MGRKKSNQKSPKKQSVSKFFEHICNLSEQEHKEIVDFARLSLSPSTNKDADLLEAFLDNLDPNKEEDAIWEQVFADEETRSLNQLRNRLLATLQRYAAIYQMEKNSHLKNTLLTKYYTNANLSKNKKAIYRDTEKALKKAKDDFELPIYKFWFYKTKLESENGKRKWSDNPFKMLEELARFSTRNYLRLTAVNVNQFQILSDFPKDLEEQLMAELPRRINQLEAEEENLPAIEQLGLHLLKMVLERQRIHFDTVKEKLNNLRPKLSPTVIEETKELLLNFCVSRINASRDDAVIQYYNREYLALKAYTSKTPFLDKNGKISYEGFKNIVASSIIANNIDWTYSFIEEYKNKIYDAGQPKHQSFLYLIEALVKLYDCRSGVHQNRCDLTAVQKALSKYNNSEGKINDDFFKIMKDKISLKVLYESGTKIRPDALLAKIDACRHRVNRNTDGKRKKQDLYFLKFFKRLSRTKSINIQEVREKVTHIDYLWFKRVLQKGGTTTK